MVLQEDVRVALQEAPVCFLATCGDNVPNVVPVGYKWLVGNELLLADLTLSQHHTDLHFSLGEATMVDELTIHWPDGVKETHRNFAVDRLISLTHTPTYPGNGSAYEIGSFYSRAGAETQLGKES